MDSIPQKRCAKCQQDFPATTEYFRANKAGKYGVCNPCKTCSRIEYAAKHPKPPTIEGMKRCSKCREWKPTDAFYANRTSGKLVSHCKLCQSLTRKAHRQEHKEFWQEYEQSHKERIRQASKKYRETHRDQKRAEGRLYYHTHKDEYHQRYKRYLNIPEKTEQKRRYAKQYDATHAEEKRAYRQSRREHRKAHNQRYRALKRHAQGSYTGKDIQAQYEQQKGKCYYCQSPMVRGNGQCHIEHIVPLTRGGTNHISNVVLACAHCNCSKRNRLPHEWPQGNRLL